MLAVATVFIGLAGGLAVGASIVAFFTVLGVVTRVIEWTNSKDYLKYYQISIIVGALLSCLIYFFDLTLVSIKLFAVPLWLFMGIYVGMIAAALTETLDIISIFATKLGIIKWIYLIIFAIILGKVIGSAIFFLIPDFF